MIRREYPTAIPPVDLVCHDLDGTVVAVEVKRERRDRWCRARNTSNGCGLDSSLGNIRGVFVAQMHTRQARVLAEARGLHWIEVDYDELRGMAPDELRLF